jgi:hypothetical protein
VIAENTGTARARLPHWNRPLCEHERQDRAMTIALAHKTKGTPTLAVVSGARKERCKSASQGEGMKSLRAVLGPLA